MLIPIWMLTLAAVKVTQAAYNKLPERAQRKIDKGAEIVLKASVEVVAVVAEETVEKSVMVHAGKIAGIAAKTTTGNIIRKCKSLLDDPREAQRNKLLKK